MISVATLPRLMKAYNTFSSGDKIYLSLVIPAFNEENRLPLTLESVGKYLPQQSYAYEVIVVDGGSTDKTSTVVKNFQKVHPQFRLIRLPKNRGKGFCVRTGILESKGRFVIFTDADLATPIKEVEKILSHLDKGFDVVIGSRRHADSKIVRPQNWIRRQMGRAYNQMNRWLGIRGVEDVPCGFKGFRREAAEKIFGTIKLDGYAFDAEVLYLTQNIFNLRWKQVPIEWKNFPGSKINILRDPIVMTLDLIKIKLYDLRGLYK
jgi:dolichyl-phosphate beta-glucosyltransferase